MYQVSKTEKELILKKFPYATVIRCQKGKCARHSYLVEHNPEIEHFLEDIRTDISNADKWSVRRKIWKPSYKKHEGPNTRYGQRKNH